jgi:hypothetical protein
MVPDLKTAADAKPQLRMEVTATLHRLGAFVFLRLNGRSLRT